ncbi:hypothetical protein FA09DRAFT_229236 [Tilletiopsis washingtonensis]|uniref:Uncharacterized protein n=1 Tax=Tilletiopsis washingtonensis TaxID=58919 RepID=A0A316ZDI9_9BASI|nr:hypothetical protein FA09DRAFT_229236 [Tilletiopsis washingtonensis]PWN99376.1 hypothetical protein FA09DRAFT_229236 [Tilletiopsis washingtonensis]
MQATHARRSSACLLGAARLASPGTLAASDDACLAAQRSCGATARQRLALFSVRSSSPGGGQARHAARYREGRRAEGGAEEGRAAARRCPAAPLRSRRRRRRVRTALAFMQPTRSEVGPTSGHARSCPRMCVAQGAATYAQGVWMVRELVRSRLED